MDNHIHLIWQIKGNVSTSEVQKQFLENCSRNIKKDSQFSHPKVLDFFKSTQQDRNYDF
jgi:REP element-mobilizing transposase RayT